MGYLKILSTILLGVAIVSGCAMGNDEARDQDNQNVKVQNVDEDRDRGNNDNNQNEDNQSRMSVADEAQVKIEEMNEIRHATVIVSDRNAFVAVVQDNNETGDLRRDLENKISDQVKSTDTNIQNVYVSSNPDFVDRMQNYGNKIEDGQPVQGLFEEFSEMVQRVFPNAR